MDMPYRIKSYLTNKHPRVQKEWLENLEYVETPKEPWLETWAVSHEWWKKHTKDPLGYSVIIIWWKEKNSVSYRINVNVADSLPKEGDFGVNVDGEIEYDQVIIKKEDIDDV